MTKGEWERGEAPGFWMEDDPPSGLHDYFVYDDTSGVMEYHYHILALLDKLGIIEHGTIYESTDCIRIKVRND